MGAEYTVFDISQWFLNKEKMQHKKIQKLCYYAQAWHYTLYKSALFDGDFEAWAHGPVNRQLWNELKKFGYEEIGNNILNNTKTIDKDTQDFLGIVWNTYGEFDGWQLESLTHSESPWINARGNLSELQRCTNIISADDMIKCYSEMYTGDGIGE